MSFGQITLRCPNDIPQVTSSMIYSLVGPMQIRWVPYGNSHFRFFSSPQYVFMLVGSISRFAAFARRKLKRFVLHCNSSFIKDKVEIAQAEGSSRLLDQGDRTCGWLERMRGWRKVCIEW